MRRDVRWWLVTAAAVFAVAELIDGIAYGIPPGIVFAVVVGAGAWWASRSRGWGAPALLGVLALVELFQVIFVYGHGKDPAPWWRLTIFAVLSLSVVAAAAANLLPTFRRKTDPSPSTT